jgi:nondiscriminating glutamyl-tRNA synthetase
MIRTRFAPSPTGYLHVGGARTALFSFLYAKKHGGQFVLRIEDTDVERSTRESEKSLIEDLKWLGFDWDEGPDKGGEHGPYRQSERVEIYQEYAQKLVNAGKAYFVYAEHEELEKLREKLISESKAPHYTKEMLQSLVSPEEVERRKQLGKKPAIYFSMDRKERVLNDLVKGDVHFGEDSMGDFAILRSNGLPTYNFAVVIDDALMKITHVIRGDDHLSNTVKQMAIYEALGFDVPKFAHLSTILGPDRSRLSKRHGSTSVGEYRKRGYLPQAMVNYLALLGWSHPELKELIDFDELIEVFDLDRVSKNPAVYDEKKLTWMNGQYIRKLSDDSFYEYAKPFIVPELFNEEEYSANKKWIILALKSVKSEVETLAELPEKLEVYFKEPTVNLELRTELEKSGVLIAFKSLRDVYESLDEWKVESILEATKKVLKESKVKGKDFYHPLREILTGKDSGPDLVNLIFLLGRENVVSRLRKFLEG